MRSTVRENHSGRRRKIAPALTAVAADKALCLKRAVSFERASNAKKARAQLLTFLPVLDQPLSGPSALFKRQLSERLKWARKTTLFQIQIELAYIYLKRKDMLRATIFGLEAAITRECGQSNYDEDNYDKFDAQKYSGGRMHAREKLNRECSDAFRILSDLRNSLAHGTMPTRSEVAEILDNAEGWPSEISALFTKLHLCPAVQER